MTQRYYVPDLGEQAPLVKLSDEEAAHAIKVMRRQVGDTVELFDGQGYQSAGEVVSIDRRSCVVRCQTPVAISREPSNRLELALAIPKPDRAKELVERLTELGVARVWPIMFERTQRAPPAGLLDKLHRVVIEACKQSGRNHRLEIAPPMSLDEWSRSLLSGDASATWAYRWLAQPGGRSLTESLAEVASIKVIASLPSAIAVIGPEGGLTNDEQTRLADAGLKSIGLGRRILRIETAATVLAARWLVD